jgi:hypothetical protein
VRAHKWDATENGTFAYARPAIKYRMFTHMCPSAEKWASVRLGNRDLSTASQRRMSREMGHVLALFYFSASKINSQYQDRWLFISKQTKSRNFSLKLTKMYESYIKRLKNISEFLSLINLCHSANKTSKFHFKLICLSCSLSNQK